MPSSLPSTGSSSQTPHDEQRLRDAIDALPAAVYMTDAEGKLTHFNAAAVEMAGRVPVLGVDRWCVTWKLRRGDGTLLPHEQCPMAIALREGRTIRGAEVVVERPDGERRWAAVWPSPLRDREGRVIGGINMVLDITHAKRAEAERDESLVRERGARNEAETLNEVARTLGAGLDLQEIVQKATDAATQLTGARVGAFFYNVESESGESYVLYTLSGAPREAFERFGLPRNTALFGPTFRGEGVVRLDDVLADERYGRSAPHEGIPHGHLPVRSYLAVPVRSGTGEVIGALFFGHPDPGVFTERAERIACGIAAQAAIAIDNGRLLLDAQREIEQRKRGEAALRESEERLRNLAENLEQLVRQRTFELEASQERLRMSERLAALGTLSAGLGHDIGNVMMPLRVQLDTLQAQWPDLPEPMREHFQSIRKAAEYLQSLASGLRLLAIDPENDRGSASIVDLHEWWQETEPLLTNVLTRRIPLEAEIAPELPALDVPKHLLTQVLFNLVQNAGQALAGATPVDGGRVRVRISPDGDGMRLVVTDNGPGMSGEVRRRCLEPFFTTKTRGISSGMGLALVHGIVQRAGGTLAIESAPGRGVTCTITLPAPPPRAPAARDREQPAAIIDLADPRAGALAGHVLSRSGFAVVQRGRSDVSDHRGRAELLLIDERSGTETAIEAFLGHNPDGRVIVVGRRSAGTSNGRRIIGIDHLMKPADLRSAIERSNGRHSRQPT